MTDYKNPDMTIQLTTDIAYHMDVATIGESITGYAVICGPLVLAWCHNADDAYAHLAKVELADALFGWMQ